MLSYQAFEYKVTFSYVNHVVMLTSFYFHKKCSEVCIKARSTPASLFFKGLVTEQRTVKRSILSLLRFQYGGLSTKALSTSRKQKHVLCRLSCINFLPLNLSFPRYYKRGITFLRYNWVCLGIQRRQPAVQVTNRPGNSATRNDYYLVPRGRFLKGLVTLFQG